MSRLVIVLLLFVAADCSYAAEPRYPTPPGARDARHVRLADTGGEQDFFVVSERYPSTAVLERYRKVFSQWTECKPAGGTWQSFGAVSGANPRFVHQILREWVRPDNKSLVTVALFYRSEGAQFRARPDSDTQHVVLIEYATEDARRVRTARVQVRWRLTLPSTGPAGTRLDLRRTSRRRAGYLQR